LLRERNTGTQTLIWTWLPLVVPIGSNERAMLNTGRVIRDVNADVIAVVEAEDRGDVWRGWMYFAAGPFPKPLRRGFTLEPADGNDAPQLTKEPRSPVLERSPVNTHQPTQVTRFVGSSHTPRCYGSNQGIT
jgi:hypothetical protein